jgi:hypothetical protein
MTPRVRELIGLVRCARTAPRSEWVRLRWARAEVWKRATESERRAFEEWISEEALKQTAAIAA